MSQRRWKTLLAIWSLLILIATLIPGRQLRHLPDVSVWSDADLWVHALLFAGFGFLKASVSPVIKDNTLYRKPVFKLMVCGIVFGGTTELLQSVLPIQRDSSWFDFMADIAGLLFGIIIWSLLHVDRKPRHLN